MRRVLPVLLLLAAIAPAQAPYRESDLVMPDQVAPHMKGVLFLHVGFSVLYRAAHVAGSEFAGPGSQPEGIELLRKAVAGQPHDREIIIYCGCCPWDKCPNVRPALRALHEMGFRNVRAMVIPGNLKIDWIDKGYPTEKRSE